MKIYKVEIEILDCCDGRYQGMKLIGHYVSKEKAERVAREAYENRCKVDRGDTEITEIEVDDTED